MRVATSVAALMLVAGTVAAQESADAPRNVATSVAQLPERCHLFLQCHWKPQRHHFPPRRRRVTCRRWNNVRSFW
jgi:hypothetical protein